jgi:hypothetical protein
MYCRQNMDIRSVFFMRNPRSLQRCTAIIRRQHLTSSPRVVDNREVVFPTRQCAAANGRHQSKNFWHYIKSLYCRKRHFSKFVTFRFFLNPETETSIERLPLCWRADRTNGGDKTALQNSRKCFPRLLRRPSEMKEIVYWCRLRTFRKRLLAPECKYAVLIIPSVSELPGHMFK